MSFVLFFDVGNTNTKICLADERGLGESYSLPTRPANTADDWGLKIERILARENVSPEEVESCAISSVVPPLDPVLTRMAKRYFECDAVFVPRDLSLPLLNQYAQPEQVGADILVAAYAARVMFDEENIIVVGFGTATTLACVVGDAFVGGLICPGVLSSASALATGTAKLPNVDLTLPEGEFRWGRTTSECLNQGLVYGFAEMVEGLCSRLAKGMDSAPKIVATGGLARDISIHCPTIADVRPELIMEGLWYAWFR